MQQQLNNENPEIINSLEEQKGREELKKKKLFKIKKIKMSNGRKLKQQDIFNNPIYAGLQNQDDENQNRQNFGPWIHQDIKNKDIKSHLPTQRVQYLTHRTQEVSERLIQNNDTDEIFYQNEVMQDSEPLQLSVLPEIKQKKELHELRFSSLVLEAPRLSSISPAKFQKSKMQRLNRNKSQSQSSQLLKYISLKTITPLQKTTDKKINSKPNNVIYNYCCSSNQNNIMGYFQDPFYKNSSNKSVLSNKNLFKDQISSIKLSNPGTIEAKKYSLEVQQQEINLFKKSISKQLLNDLIRKKNKLK